jgi:hypothetical protein
MENLEYCKEIVADANGLPMMEAARPTPPHRMIQDAH